MTEHIAVLNPVLAPRYVTSMYHRISYILNR